MRGSAEVANGRVEEAAGTLANNDKMWAKGQTDPAVGRVKEAAEVGVRHAKDDALTIVDKAKIVAQQAVDNYRYT